MELFGLANQRHSYWCSPQLLPQPHAALHCSIILDTLRNETTALDGDVHSLAPNCGAELAVRPQHTHANHCACIGVSYLERCLTEFDKRQEKCTELESPGQTLRIHCCSHKTTVWERTTSRKNHQDKSTYETTRRADHETRPADP